ncbi:MAG: histidine phosphatase family protein [Pirellulaceae bacterium]|nr:histidine phosphatase family protein [Pirellulaceae bacterium]
MKTLLILRHAKSSWSDASLSDHDRPLNERGLAAAPRMGQLIAQQDLIPDLIISSTATRARTTTERVVAACAYTGPIEWYGDFYLAPPATYVEKLGSLPDEITRVLVVGHNPGMENLAAQLTGVHESFPTAALAHVRCELATWPELTLNGSHSLVDFWRPKEL